MNQPRLLQQGDKVSIVATARKVSLSEMRPAIDLLNSWGLQVILPKGLFEHCNQFAGDDNNRAQMMQEALDNDDIRAIFCARGGYGTVRIIDKLDFTAFVKNPKWIVGYSDITVLHSHIQKHFGIPTLHAIMPINIPEDASSAPTSKYPAIDSLKKALFCGPQTELHSHSSTFPNRRGEASAPIVGGNLSILYSLLASPSDIDTDGKILFIEDLDEYLYHIDRMMQSLKRAGKFEHLKGLIVGAMSDMHDNSVPFGKSAEDIIWDAVKDYTYPVWFNAPYGHIETDNIALCLGSPTRLTVN